ncbi:spore germination protein (amino acid permease) [Paenibacillus catalpae]|uniref:Spore germination protein (Amino acid permease) n=1 Tax=Paenibacillus catalpae TaxID=1045775 RepID=A0A1I1UZZ4_9BACL|nr:endospore germination permease [Paenibacillus catalpae]SFD76125.1 spore germination protein (amino acid permease) [Paenibacillus catalpae]
MESAEKISGRQFSLLIFSFIAPTVILVIPGLMSNISKQDAWMTIFPSVLIGALNIWIMIKLSKRYPGMTIVQYSSEILGKWLGKVLGCYLIYVWINFDFIILNQHIQFINTVFLMRTPSVIISLTLAILCGIAVYMGIEAIARCNEYLALLNFVFLIPLLLLMLAESDPERLRPVLGNGIFPVLQASVFPIAYISQFFILGWLLPFLNQPKKASKVSFISLFIISGLLCITLLPLIMVFGPLTEKLVFPVLSVIQYIGIEGSFERLEALAVAIWVMGCFIKISTTLFIICLSIGQIFNIRNYKDLVIPITILSVIGSVTVFRNYSTDLGNYLNSTYPSYAFFTHFVLPLTLLIIDSVKRSWRKSVH